MLASHRQGLYCKLESQPLHSRCGDLDSIHYDLQFVGP